MARPSRIPTLLTERTNLVVVVGGSPRIGETTTRAANAACGARVITATLDRATTVATEHCPFAIVVPKDLYEFGGPEFDALARDVRAELIVVPETVPPAVLTALLIEAAASLR